MAPLTAQHLRVLLSRYAEARIAQFERDTVSNRRALKEAAEVLCGATGSPDIKAALFKADDLLAAGAPELHLPRRAAGARETSRVLMT
ncbi:DUF5133 domain-containing protein [Streptomyces albidoflavus]